MKVYIAARFEDIKWARTVRETLRNHGIEVVSKWLDEDGAKTFDVITADGEQAAARQFAERDLAELDAADVLVHVQPLAKTTTGGNHVEFGYALAKGKLICSLGLPPQPRTNVFHYLPGVRWFGMAETLAGYLAAEAWRRGPATSDAEPETILQEAQRLVHGNRGADYGHPLEDFSRTAMMWTAILLHKLKPGCVVDYNDVGRGMCCVKISRDVNKPKRDNLTDNAGYSETLQMCRDRVAAEAASSKWTMTETPFGDAGCDIALAPRGAHTLQWSASIVPVTGPTDVVTPQ